MRNNLDYISLIKIERTFLKIWIKLFMYIKENLQYLLDIAPGLPKTVVNKNYQSISILHSR